jgi:hypothetical protein
MLHLIFNYLTVIPLHCGFHVLPTSMYIIFSILVAQSQEQHTEQQNTMKLHFEGYLGDNERSATLNSGKPYLHVGYLTLKLLSHDQ